MFKALFWVSADAKDRVYFLTIFMQVCINCLNSSLMKNRVKANAGVRVWKTAEIEMKIPLILVKAIKIPPTSSSLIKNKDYGKNFNKFVAQSLLIN